MDILDPIWLKKHLTSTKPARIADDVAILIKEGTIRRGVKLPSVRDLAVELGISPTSVSGAWKRLKAMNLIDGGGRAGITVTAACLTPRPMRFESELVTGDDIPFNLQLGVPDPKLLPNFQTALAKLELPADLHKYNRVTITPRLQEAAAIDWPYQPETFLAVNGGYEGLVISIRTLLRAGDVVLVESPTPPRILDVLDDNRCRSILINRDDEGPIASEVKAALEREPAAFLVQPVLHNPTGGSMSERRRDELVELLKDHPEILIIEDDGFGLLAEQPHYTLSEHLPHHIYVRSYSKSHGSDLRLAVVESSEFIVDALHSFLGFGAGWTSRLLQELLAWMLTDEDTRKKVHDATLVYAERREALQSALARRGIPSTGGGLHVWVEVPDESFALEVAKAHGIALTTGLRYGIDTGHIRLSTGTLDPSNADQIADVLDYCISRSS